MLQMTKKKTSKRKTLDLNKIENKEIMQMESQI